MTVIDVRPSRPASRAPGRPGRPGRLGRRSRRPGPGPTSSTAGASSQQTLALTLGLLVVVLTLLGSVMILSASSVVAVEETGSAFAVFVRQAMWLAVGVVGFAVGARVDHQRWSRALPVLVLGSVGLLLLVLVPGIGINVNGAQRWLGTGAWRLQPAEPAKFALVVFTAALVARFRHALPTPGFRPLDVLRPLLVVLGTFATLLMLQPNLGTTAVLCGIVGFVLLWAGFPGRILAGLGITAVLLGVGFALSADYRRARITGFLDPWETAGDAGYQTIQSLIGVASGGVSGTGLGASRAKWGFLPEAHTDFVFSIIGEELGLLGSLAVVGLFAGLIACGLHIATRARDDFGELLAVGIVTWFAVQGFVNVGAVLGLLPITGVPLPFVSFGGSSLVSTMFAAGVLANIALAGVAPEEGVRQRIAARRAANRRS